MSDDLQEPQSPDTVFEPLKAGTTRTEAVDGGPASPAPDTVFEPLKATTTRTEGAGPADATPLVVVDDDDEQPTGEIERTIPELLGELRSLTSRNMILRTERTSMAGRKYALEVVIETLREKLTAVAELCERLDAPGELGEALREIKEIVGDAQRIADSKSVLEADLEAERAKHLEERQRFEEKTSELNENLAGVRSERDSLRSQVTRVERDRLALQARLDELEGQAVGQVEAYVGQIGDLETQVATLQTQLAQGQVERNEAVRNLEEAVQHSETLATEIEALKDAVEAAQQERLDEAAAKVAELQEAQAVQATVTGKYDRAQLLLQTVQGELTESKVELEAAAAKVAAAEAKAMAAEAAQGDVSARITKLDEALAKKKATIKDQRKALLEMKPILEDWGKLEKENNRLSRLVGEARDRGRVNIQGLMARAALLKRLERLTAEEDEDDD